MELLKFSKRDEGVWSSPSTSMVIRFREADGQYELLTSTRHGDLVFRKFDTAVKVASVIESDTDTLS